MKRLTLLTHIARMLLMFASMLQQKVVLAGKNFSYMEAQAVPGRIAAYIGSFVFVFFGALLTLKPVRSLALKVLPSPGKMPKRELVEGGAWSADVVAISDEPEGGQPTRVKAHLSVRFKHYSYAPASCKNWKRCFKLDCSYSNDHLMDSQSFVEYMHKLEPMIMCILCSLRGP